MVQHEQHGEMPDELNAGAHARPDRGLPAPTRERYLDSAGGDANSSVPGRESGIADGAGAAQYDVEGSGAASEHQEASLRPAGSVRAGGDNGCDALLATATAKLQMTRSMSEGFLANLSKGTLHSQQGVLVRMQSYSTHTGAAYLWGAWRPFAARAPAYTPSTVCLHEMRILPILTPLVWRLLPRALLLCPHCNTRDRGAALT